MKWQEMVFVTVEMGRKQEKGVHTHNPSASSIPHLQPTGKMLSDSRPDQPLVYLERLELIRNACKEEALRNLSHTEVSKFVLDRIFVCDKHKILFCQTPKVGNTQWKKVLIVLNGMCGMWGRPPQWERGQGWHQMTGRFLLKTPMTFQKVLCVVFHTPAPL